MLSLSGPTINKLSFSCYYCKYIIT